MRPISREYIAERPARPTHTVRSPGHGLTFSCCETDTARGSNGSLVAWFGGPKGSALRLQRWNAKAEPAKGLPGRWDDIATTPAPPSDSTSPSKASLAMTDC